MESALAEGFAAGAGTAAQVLGPYFLCFALLGCAALALRKGVRRKRSGTRRRHGTRGGGRGGIGFALSLLLALILLKLLPLALVLALLLALLLAFYFKAGSLGASVGGGAARQALREPELRYDAGEQLLHGPLAGPEEEDSMKAEKGEAMEAEKEEVMEAEKFALALACLRETFGFGEFRPLQEQAVKRVLSGADSLVLMPTGGGKSVCYQVPALVLEGCAVVISPLLALMKDQVDSLRANGVSAAALNSQTPPDEARQIRGAFCSGALKLLYLSPERLSFELGALLLRGQVSLFAVDEAHCISAWGHDFRPEYQELHKVREAFPGVPMLALTATADAATRSDILKQLSIPAEGLLVASFDRPNIALRVFQNVKAKEKRQLIFRFLRAHRGESGIVYCLSRATTEKFAAELCAEGFGAEAYHAGLASEERTAIQERFVRDETAIVCATIAFGMGIDKSNVRWVIHYNTPKNVEGYYQEIGRAGRDGSSAWALLFYSDSDMAKLAKFAEESGEKGLQLEKLSRMEHYATSPICRRRVLLGYFGEVLGHDCGNCDVCQNPPKRFDGTVLAQKALSAVARVHGAEGAEVIVGILRGSNRRELAEKHYDELKTFGVGRDVPAKEWELYLRELVHLGALSMAYTEGHPLGLTAFGKEILRGQAKVELAKVDFKAEGEEEFKPKKQWKRREGGEKLWQALRALRRDLAEEQNVPAYVVFSDKTLEEIVARAPKTLSELAEAPGIGKFKLEKFGHAILSVLLTEA